MSRRVRDRAERSTASRSTSPMRTESCRAGRHAATASKAKTSPSTSERSARSRCACVETTAAGARGPRRGIPAHLRFPRAQRACRDEAETRAEPPAMLLPARSGRRIRRSLRSAHRVMVYGTGARGALQLDSHSETLAWLREHGFRTKSVRRAARVDRRCRARMHGMGTPPDRPSTTRSTASCKSTRSTSKRDSVLCTNAPAGAAHTSGRR